MKIGKIMKTAPLVLALMVLIPASAMAASYSGQDYSTLSGSSVSWNAHISQDLGNVPVHSTFSWYNEFHNANGGNADLTNSQEVSCSCEIA